MKKVGAFFRGLLALVFLLCTPTGAQAAEVVIDDGFDERVIGKDVELAYDPSGAVSLEEVLAGKLMFTPSHNDVPSFGYRGGAEWVRVSFRNQARAQSRPPVLLYGYGQIDRIDVFDVRAGAPVRHRVAGDQVPLQLWEGVDRFPYFSIPPGDSDVVIRVSGTSSKQIPLTVRSGQSHERQSRRDVMVQSLYFGALTIMAAYNALLAAVTRSRAYLYYVGYLLSFAGASLSLGGFLVYLEPSRLSLLNYANPWSFAAVGFFSLRFTRYLLAIDTTSGWGRATEWCALGSVVAIALASCVNYESSIAVARALLPVGVSVMFGTAVSMARRGAHAAKLFLFAWSMFVVGVIVNLLRVNGLIPTNAVTTNILQVGSALEFLLLSLALADRIKRLQLEATANAQLAASNARDAEVATARALVEQERTNEELARMDKLKDAFLANTSHELRTPLHGILGLTESVLAANVGLDATSRERLGMVLASGRRLSSLVNDILDFSKLRHQAIELREKNLDLREAVNLALSVIIPSAEAKRIALRSEVIGETFVRGDENRLQQILVNLLGNAVKFTAQGEVVVRAEQRDGRVFIAVQDTGIGIAPEFRARIFESFEQGDGSTSREFGGTGLGLAVTKQLVELHGGRVDVDSEPGRGSTFTFDLSLAERGEESMSSEATGGRGSVLLRAAGPPPPTLRTEDFSFTEVDARMPPIVLGSRGHVLVADDDPVNVEVLRAQLEPAGYAVSTARDGAEAVATLERLGQVDGVLLDVMMPKMTGVEAAARIRAANPHGTLPILMLTAKSRPEDVIVGMRAGASDYIGKPFHREELLQRVDAHVQAVKTSRAFRRFVPEDFLGLLGVERFDALTAGIGQRHEVTVLFTDVRGFTTRSEQLGPEGIFRFINASLERFEPVVRRHGGFVDKFIGDAVMAIFPGDSIEAAHAAEGLQREVEEFNRARPNAAMPLSIGVGVHRGPVILGTVGGADRMEVTAIGDAVNVAARLESLTKGLGAGALVSEEVLRGATGEARRVGAVRVKGRARAVELFELLNCCATDQERRQKAAAADRFQRGLRAYAQGDMARAREHFVACVDEAPLDRVAFLYAERSKHYLDVGVPEGFDGCLEGL